MSARLSFTLVILLLTFFASSSVFAAEAGFVKPREKFGQQLFVPTGGFIVDGGTPLPQLVWKQPKLVASLVGDPTIRTRWFDAELNETQVADNTGRYYAFGEAKGPGDSAFRRAMTCVCVPSAFDLRALAKKRSTSGQIDELLKSWRHTEEGAVQLAAILESDGGPESRTGQWQMENATRHVRLKRKVMGLTNRAPVVVRARRHGETPAPVLRRGPLAEAGISADQVAKIEAALDTWYATAKKPNAVVIAKNGVIVLAKSYGKLDGAAVTIDTPLLLHSAMKPLMGVQLAMYVDRGLVRLEQPIGEFLPDFNTAADRQLTFRAGHAHLSGIHFPWPLAFSRLFYFRPWQDSLIVHQPREWVAGSKYRYGVVGIILAVRSLELLSGRNYWDAMEREVFEPLDIRNILPGGTGFSAENLARIGVMLHNHGRYGAWELFSEKTYREIIPKSLLPHFPHVDMVYGIGLQSHASRLGPGSYGHGGGCGTQLTVNPKHRLVFAMTRNERGPEYKAHLAKVMKALRGWTK